MRIIIGLLMIAGRISCIQGGAPDLWTEAPGAEDGKLLRADIGRNGGRY